MSSPVAPGSRLGPIEFQPGITTGNALTKLYASFVTIACLTGMSLLQGYILTEHLHVPRSQQGTVSGTLAFWTEVVSLLCFIPFGNLADRIGRRPVYVFGILIIGLGWGLFPFATSPDQLMAYRLIYGVGAAAAVGALSTMVNDYPLESSRGKFIGVTAMMNVLGTIFVARVLGGIPAIMVGQGYDPVTAGRVMFLSAAALCLVTAVILPETYALSSGALTPAHRHAGSGVIVTS